MQSQTKVLVAYASRHGSTRGVAERVAKLLDGPRTQVDVRRVDQVDDGIAAYDAVVFGSAVYDGSWRP
jgi:menaquinone-dependent protoporphyrinogen oxidase